MLNSTRARVLIAVGIACVYIALAALAAATLRPRADEGFFASPALNLVQTGSMGTPVIEGGHAFMKDIHKYTYWITPLHFVVQAAWYAVFGFSLFSMRALSILWALIAIAAWYLMLRRISGSASIALFGAALIGLDYNFIIGGSSGRMDMMAASLGFCAFAAYGLLRERNFGAAMLVSNALVCAAGLTHPVAGYLYFCGIVFVILYYDARRIRPTHVALAALPYLIGAAGWGAYILKDPSAFQSQFTNNATMHGRLTGLSAPWMGFIREIKGRYLMTFGLGYHSFGHDGPVYLKIFILLAFMIGLAGAVLTPEIRRNKGYRGLMLLAALFFVLLSVFDGQKAYYYLVHIFPFYAALTAVWIAHVWNRRAALRPILALSVAGVLTLQLGAVIYHATRYTYARTYEPAIEFLKAAVPPGRTIMGSASLGFGLDFSRNLVDDVRLGCLTARKPDFIVVNEEYRMVFRDYSIHEPELFEFIRARLTREYDRVFDQAGVQVYERRDEDGQARSNTPPPPASPVRGVLSPLLSR